METLHHCPQFSLRGRSPRGLCHQGQHLSPALHSPRTGFTGPTGSGFPAVENLTLIPDVSQHLVLFSVAQILFSGPTAFLRGRGWPWAAQG